MKLIILNGLPATGKTTMGKELSKRLELPLISKDIIKEFLFDTIGTRDREWSRSLGKASNDFLYILSNELLSTNSSFIIENAFEREFAIPKLRKLIEKYQPEIFEIYCETDSALRRDRFKERNETGQRHQGHFDTVNYLDNNEEEPLEKYGALNIGHLIKVNTNTPNGYDIERLIEQLDT